MEEPYSCEVVEVPSWPVASGVANFTPDQQPDEGTIFDLGA